MKCIYFVKVFRTKSTTISTIAQKDQRGVSFLYKLSNECILQVDNVKMCGAQVLFGQYFAAEQTTKCDPRLKETKIFRENSKLLPCIETTIDQPNLYSHLKLCSFFGSPEFWCGFS